MSDPDLPPPPSTWRERLDLIGGSSGYPPAQLALGAAGVVVALAAGWLLLRPPSAPVSVVGPPPTSSTTATTEAVTIVAHVSGAVRAPGVYTLAAGARTIDLIDAAGGATPDADLEQLNLAAPLVDGSKVRVPRVGEVVVTPAAGGAAAPGPLDLNAATVDQLDALPGVGPATADAIVAERARRGGRFRAVDDLLDVRGIGPAKLAAIKDLVRV